MGNSLVAKYEDEKAWLYEAHLGFLGLVKAEESPRIVKASDLVTGTDDKEKDEGTAPKSKADLAKSNSS